MIYDFRGPNRFLSNFHEKPVLWLGHVYPSVEAAYQAQKYPVELRKAFETMKPAPAKVLGTKAKLPEDWEAHKFYLMFELLKLKFWSGPERDKLIATGDVCLVEGNNWGDKLWGQCPVGVGQNFLGRMLMVIRHYAKQDQYVPHSWYQVDEEALRLPKPEPSVA